MAAAGRIRAGPGAPASPFSSSSSPGFDWGAPFFEYLRDAFDVLYEEGARTPRMMQIGLHNRLVGRRGRIGHLKRFLDRVQKHDAFWLCRGIDIARH